MGWQDAPLASDVQPKQPNWMSAPLASDAKDAAPSSFGDKALKAANSLGTGFLRGVGNIDAGLIRGAGSIGATLLAPVDAAARAMGVQNDFIGRSDRREAMDAGLHSLGADPNSIAYQGGKLTSEVAGTLGAGGAVARGAAAIPGVVRAAPALIDAIGSAGFKAGGATNLARAAGATRLADLGTRVAGGAIAGGASAGLIDPNDAGTGAAIGGAVGGAAPGLLRLIGKPAVAAAVPKPTLTAEQILAQQAGAQSTGAAGAVVPANLLSPELRSAIVDTGGNIDPNALARHVDTEQLVLPEGTTPLRLRKGQATNDAQQISDEKNMRADKDTQGLLTDSITDQDQKLVAAQGEIRRQATPTIVQRSNQEHGQALVDAIKDQDNKTVLDVRAKYKALADANGGAIPIDTGATIDGIDSKLQRGYLTKTARDNGVVSSVMDDLRSGRPMDFESFENARTRLAEVQRQGGSDAAAAGIVRDALENMQLPEGAEKLKALANDARSAAKARFDTIDQNPAYEAAINDNVPKRGGLHVAGAPSPLADSFMDRYVLGNGTNASKAYVARLKSTLTDPSVSQTIEAATLNKLRDAAGIDVFGNGSFRNASYRNQLNSLASKYDVLMSPDSIEASERLKRVSGYVTDEPKASSTNRSNTALTLQRFGAPLPPSTTTLSDLANHAADMGASLVPGGSIVKKIGGSILTRSQDAKAEQAIKDAKLAFARDATKPGAGLLKSPSR